MVISKIGFFIEEKGTVTVTSPTEGRRRLHTNMAYHVDASPQVGLAQVGLAQVGLAQVGLAQVGLGLSRIGPK